MEVDCEGVMAVYSACVSGAGSVEERKAKRFSTFGFQISYEARIKSRDGIKC